jgi:hypothetical protein
MTGRARGTGPDRRRVHVVDKPNHRRAGRRATRTAGAIAAQITYARTGARHHRTHNAARSMPGRRHLLRAIAAALPPPSGTILHERAMIAMSQAGFDGDSDARILSWGEESLRRCHEERSIRRS